MRTVWRVCGLTVLLALSGGSVAVGAAASPPITFYFGLKRPEARARAAFFAVQRPGSPSYRRFSTLPRVAVRYGASPSVRAAFIGAAGRRGLSVRIDRSGVFARVSGSVAEFERVFRVRVRSSLSNDPNVNTYVVPSRLHLPPDMRRLVRDVVPSFTRSAGPPGGVRSRAGMTRHRPRPPRRSGTWTRGCTKARATGAFSFGQVRHAYGIDRLGGGAGASVAILNLAEGVSARDIADNARCFGYPKLHPRTLRTDGQAQPFRHGLFEPQEDLALVRGMAPNGTSLTFTQSWTSPELWFLAASQVLDAGRLPDSLSMSYGLCERDVRGRGSPSFTRAGANLMDSLLLRLGLAGVGSYASAGDFGSTCNGHGFAGVTWPASSPYVTAVGGTRLTLTRANQRHSEVVWNDLRWSATGGAGGGGFAVASARPPFQRGLGLPGRARAVPDVSAAASMFPGWPVVMSGFWVQDAGTSSSAPLVASAMAILSADQRRRNHAPLGPANGLLYARARRAPATLRDVVSGANGYLRRVPARHAKRGYDLASGLGVPEFARLAAALNGAPSFVARR